LGDTWGLLGDDLFQRSRFDFGSDFGGDFGGDFEGIWRGFRGGSRVKVVKGFRFKV
jgi:hypothetical protein